ncbi:MAG: two-component system response regulator [Paenibacillus sp.]|nr:two-component system response regulator [Paenibacillus sp.]
MYKVMIADQDPVVRRTLMQGIHIHSHSFSVISEVESIAEAMHIIQSAPPNLLLADVHNIELAEYIRDHSIPTEWILLCDDASVQYAHRAIRLGASDILQKPVHEGSLHSALRLVQDKLLRAERDLLEAARFTAACRELVGRLVRQLWVAHEQGVYTELIALHDLLLQQQQDRQSFKEWFLRVMSLLSAEIEELSSKQLQLWSFPRFTIIPQPERTYEHLSMLLGEVLEEIRRMRNWGARHKMLRAVDYINRGYSKKSVSIKRAAKLAGITPTYFSKAFKEEMGVNFTRYIAELRMQKAIDLLDNPNTKVYEVAFAVGYSDYAHFEKMFKKNYGFSPSDYRNKLQII